jgi:metal-responsive CopG/Arc/MetJ family transcriptional regulator
MHRPPTGGRDPILSVRLPKELIKRIDKWAKLNDVTRSEAVRRLIEHALPT